MRMADDVEADTGTTRWRVPDGLRHEALDDEHLVLLVDRNMVLRLDGEAARLFRAIAEGHEPTDVDEAVLDALAEHGVIVGD
jgi:hypothetical protein